MKNGLIKMTVQPPCNTHIQDLQIHLLCWSI